MVAQRQLIERAVSQVKADFPARGLSGVGPSVAIPIVLVNAFYAYSLSFGYLLDDATLVPFRFSEIPGYLATDHFRPLWLLSYPAASALSESAWLHHLVNLALLNVCLLLAYRIVQDHWGAPLLVAAIFLHPSFIYPTTWIAQRSDLILLALVLLTVLTLNRRASYLFTLLSDLAKSPFIFQNLYVAYHAFRHRRNYLGALLLIAPLAPLIWLGYTNAFGSYLSAEDPSGLANLNYSSPLALLFAIVARAIKVAEGAAYLFVPFPAVYGTPLMAVVSIGYIAV